MFYLGNEVWRQSTYISTYKRRNVLPWQRSVETVYIYIYIQGRGECFTLAMKCGDSLHIHLHTGEGGMFYLGNEVWRQSTYTATYREGGMFYLGNEVWRQSTYTSTYRGGGNVLPWQ